MCHNAPFVPTIQPSVLDTVDLAKLREELNPDTLGFESGQQGLPPRDAVRDPHERRIAEQLERRVRAAYDSLVDLQNEARRHLVETRTGDVGDTHATVRGAEGQFQSILEAGRLELDDKRLETEKRRTDFAKFRKLHGLTGREPHYPDGGRRGLMVGILMLLFVVESLANSAFLAKGNELGLVGAYAVAFGISALNLLSSFLIFGPSSRYLVHVRHWLRWFAGLGMLSYACMAFILNLGVAHYREVSGDLIGNAGVAVVRRMQESPFGLQDAESWLLFGLGVLFSAIAFFEGRTLDDVYPGYGRRDRSMRKARASYIEALDSVRAELDEVRESSLEAVKRIARNARKQPAESRQIAEDWRRRIAEFDRHAAHLQEVGETLIDEYREANRTARPDGVVPMAHRTPWRLTVPEIDRSELFTPDGDHSITELLQQIDREYRSATDRIQELFKSAGDSLTRATPPLQTDPNARTTTPPLSV